MVFRSRQVQQLADFRRIHGFLFQQSQSQFVQTFPLFGQNPGGAFFCAGNQTFDFQVDFACGFF